MNKQEFESRIGKEVSDRDYKVIEKVYNWNPAISNTEGKDQIAAIYQAGGMLVIRNMEETADIMIQLDREESVVRAMEEKLRERKGLVASGNLNYEKCRIAVDKAFNSADGREDFIKLLDLLKEIYGDATVNQAAVDMKLV